MVEAPNPREVHPTSISYVYTVFQHLDMLWMGIWVYHYTVTSVEVGDIFGKLACLSWSDVVMSWLRLQTP
jgi:ribosomal protein L30E